MHQLVVPKVLVGTVIKMNPGMKRTFELIALGYWWPSMRKSTVNDYVRKLTHANGGRRTKNLLPHEK
jgi:hypothetical protein